MRHAYLEEGSYEAWLEASRSGVWPYFERLGARILGDFEIVYPVGADATPGRDEALRFARYASFEALAGHPRRRPRRRYRRRRPARRRRGPERRLAGGTAHPPPVPAGVARRHLPAGPPGRDPARLYMPGLAERYEQVDGGADPDSGAPTPGAAGPGAARRRPARPRVLPNQEGRLRGVSTPSPAIGSGPTWRRSASGRWACGGSRTCPTATPSRARPTTRCTTWPATPASSTISRCATTRSPWAAMGPTSRRSRARRVG